MTDTSTLSVHVITPNLFRSFPADPSGTLQANHHAGTVLTEKAAEQGAAVVALPGVGRFGHSSQDGSSAMPGGAFRDEAVNRLRTERAAQSPRFIPSFGRPGQEAPVSSRL